MATHGMALTLPSTATSARPAHQMHSIPQAVDLGLSGLVEAQLGQPLDKALQCSAWGEVRAVHRRICCGRMGGWDGTCPRFG